jgi:hypothetical protein
MTLTRWQVFARANVAGLLPLVVFLGVFYSRPFSTHTKENSSLLINFWFWWLIFTPIASVVGPYLIVSRYYPPKRLADFVVGLVGSITCYLLVIVICSFLYFPLGMIIIILGLLIAGASIATIGHSTFIKTLISLDKRSFTKRQSIPANTSTIIKVPKLFFLVVGAIISPLVIYALSEFLFNHEIVTDMIELLPLLIAPACPAASAAFLVIFLGRDHSRLTKPTNNEPTSISQDQT